MLGDVSGIGQLKSSLQTTNELLGQVLVELRQMNAERLEAMAASMELLTTQVGALGTLVQAGADVPALR